MICVSSDHPTSLIVRK